MSWIYLEGLNVNKSVLDSFSHVLVLRLYPFAILWTLPWLYLISWQPLELVAPKEDYKDITLLVHQTLVLHLRYLNLRRGEKGERQLGVKSISLE